MSKTIDQRVVEMNFDNNQFESGVQTSLKSIKNLKEGLKFDDSTKSLHGLASAAKAFSLAGIADGVQTIASRFTTLGIIGVTALMNITNAAINTGARMLKALTVDPIMSGLDEYETKINAIQTILSNTSTKGTTMDEVNKALADLNAYADKTIYNFAQMTRNVGTFTAAGIALEPAVASIKGIANLAAVSGSNADQASTAMYQLSQALASGTVKLMDWNSVVNAGMGGQVFQDAIKETARTHGVAIDDMIKTEGSFRETLQKGWFTSEILTETLAKFTGDLTADQLRSMGLTEDQIQANLKLGQMANDAATKVKTFTQLWSTLKEAAQSGWGRTWEILIGDFEEAKVLMSEINDIIGGIIGSSAESRNALLTTWKDLGGRKVLIDSLRNAFEALMSLLKPIGEAFREIFPPITAQQLLTLTVMLKRFTENLKMGADTASEIKRIFKGVFAVFDILGMAISSVVTAVGKLFGAFGPGAASGILDFLANIGDYLVGLRDAIDTSDAFTVAIQRISDFFAPLIEKVKTFVSSILEGFGSLTGIDGSGFSGFLESLSFQFKPLGTLVDIVNAIAGAIGRLGAILAPVFLKLGTFVSDGLAAFSEALSNTMENVDFERVFQTINAGLFAAILLGIRNFIEKGSRTFDGIAGILDGVRSSLQTWQNSLKADTLLKIAFAVGILAASVIGLSMVDSGKLAAALGSMTVMFMELFGAFAVFEKMSGGNILATGAMVTGIIGISLAMLTLAGAVVLLGSLDAKSMVRGLFALTTMVVLIGVSAKTLSRISPQLIVSSIGIGILSLALIGMAVAVGMFGKMDPDKMLQGMAAIAIILTELSLFTNMTSGGVMLIGTAAGLLIISGAILILAQAIQQMGNMSWESIGKGMAAMAGALVLIGAAMYLFPPYMLLTAAGLIVVAGALVIVAGALKVMGSMSWDEIGRGLAVLAGAMIILAVGLNAMSSAIPGSLAMIIAATALSIMAVPLKILGSMSLEEIGRSLLALAGTFLVLGLAGMVLTPTIPTLLGLGAAMMLIGIGAAAVGVGVLAFSAGLAALAVSGAAGAAALVIVITSLTGLLPMIARQVGRAIVSIATAIAEGAPALYSAITKILSAMLKALKTVIPKLIDTFSTIVINLLQAMAENAPAFVRAGYAILLAFLQGIRDNIFEIATIGYDIVIQFMAAVTEKLPELIDAGFKMMISFINGLTVAVEENMPVLMESLNRLGLAIIEGIVMGLISGNAQVREGMFQIAQAAIDSFKESLGIQSPSTVFASLGGDIIRGILQGIASTLGELILKVRGIALAMLLSFAQAVVQFFVAGRNLMRGLANGINELKGTIINNVKSVITSAWNAITSKVEEWKSAGKALIQGLAEGIANAAYIAVAAARGVGNDVLNAIKKLLGIASPSKVTYEFGKFFSQGFADGIGGYSNLAVQSANKMGADAVTGLNDTFGRLADAVSGNIDMNPTIRPVFDLTDIVNGSKVIENMLGEKTINVIASANKLSTVAGTVTAQRDINSPAKVAETPAAITFTQNNYSPKALSRIDIYRQTKNQVTLLKGMVGA